MKKFQHDDHGVKQKASAVENPKTNFGQNPKALRANPPTFAAIVAVTIDGKIAADSHHFSDWTSPEDKEFLRGELAKSDAVIVGRHTFDTAKERLLKRNTIVFSGSVEEPVEQFSHVWFINPARTDIIKFVTNHNFQKIAVLGGARTYGWFVERNLIDDWYITIEPLMFGNGISLLSGLAFKQRPYKFVEMKQLNRQGTVLLHYEMKKSVNL